MAIKTQKAPKESVRELIKGVQKFTKVQKEGRRALKSLQKEKEPSNLPHKVFTLGLDDIKAGKGLEATTLIGWRYILQDDDETVLSAEVGHDVEKNEHEFLGVNKGPFVEQTLAKLNEAHLNKKIADGEFDLSVLRIPALYVMALWLQNTKGKRDFLIPLEPVNQYFEAGKLYIVKEFIGQLAKAVKKSKDQPAPK